MDLSNTAMTGTPLSEQESLKSRAGLKHGTNLNIRSFRYYALYIG